MDMSFKNFSIKNLGNAKVITKKPLSMSISIDSRNELVNQLHVIITKESDNNKLTKIVYKDEYFNELFTIITDIISLNSVDNTDIMEFIYRNPQEYFEYMKLTGKVTSIEDMEKLCSNTYIFYNIEGTTEYDIRCSTGYFIGGEEIFIKPKKESHYNREIQLFTDSIEITDNDDSIKNIYYNKRNLL